MIKLTHLAYCSTATKMHSSQELNDLLEQSREHNLKNNITGMLLYENGSYFQIIEGAPEAINKLYERICMDDRHSKVVTIIQEPIHSRSFGEWSMGYSSISTQDIEDIVGKNDFFNEGTSFSQLDLGRAKKLLHAFKVGRWHAKIQTETKSNSETETSQ